MVRQFLDVFIFLARHMVLTFAVVFVVGWLLARWRGLLGTQFTGHIKLSSMPSKRTVIGVATGLFVIFAAIGCWYLTVDGFAGEVEPIVACLSWLVQSGQPLYNDFDAAERYSVLYGPSVFLTNGLFLKVLGPSLATAKIASVIANIGSLLFLYAALAGYRRRDPLTLRDPLSLRDPLALGVTGLAILYYWTQGFAVYLVRPDALMLFAVGLGLFAAVRSRRTLALVTVAVTAGFAVNLKIHGAIYFAPVFVLVLQRFGRRDVAWVTLGTAVVTVAPFLLHPQVSLANYVGWLTNAVSHGLVTHTLDQTLRYATYLLLPVAGVVLAADDRRQVLREHRLNFAVLVPVFGLTLLLAAKPGAGPVHLLPLVPTTMFLLGTVTRTVLRAGSLLPQRLPLREAVVLATLLTALIAGMVNVYRSVRFVDFQIAQTPDLMQDVQAIMQDNPGLTISMGCGGENKNFRATWCGPLLVFANNPLLVDVISMMDSSLSGRDLSPKTFRALTEGRVAVWLVPRRQVPFAKQNWYAPHNPLFSPEFQQHFMSCYTPNGHSRYFDLWFWNGLPEIEAELPHYAMEPSGSGSS